MRVKSIHYLLISLFLGSNLTFSQDTLSIAGSWKVTLDGNFKDWPVKMGISEKWYKSELPANQSTGILNDLYFKNSAYKLRDEIILPGSTDEAEIGIPLIESAPFTIGLERKISYDGAFWAQRRVIIPQAWAGKTVYFSMERLLGASKVYWDGEPAGEDYGLAYPHQFTVETSARPGEHIITVLVDKDDLRYRQYGHHMVNGNGISWNGIIGKIELIARSPLCHIDNIQIYPQLLTKSINVKISVKNPSSIKAVAKFYLRSPNSTVFRFIDSAEISSGSFGKNIKIPGPVKVWSEFNPDLYVLKTEIISEDQILDVQSVIFGMREIGTSGGNFTLNGHKIFIRGTLDNGESPLTGYPAMQKKDWLKNLATFKSYGINLIRFHTWCPPEAAFDAADELGLYLQPELSGEPYAELIRLLNTYGNHPSFCLLSLNNEAFSHNERTQQIISDAKKSDSRHLYTCTTHPLKPDCTDDFYISAWGNQPIADWPNFEKIVGITWGGGDNITACRFNIHYPETVSDYASGLKGINAPVISHEVGQWVMYPDFDEISRYTGALRNTNYERFKKKFELNFESSKAKEFADASGKFSSLLYKEEIESALRTPNFGGFELLGLRDYPGQWTAVVGVLNPFTESKGIVTPEAHSKYCNAIVPLARLGKRVFTNDEIFSAEIDIANYSLTDILNAVPEWQLVDENNHPFIKGRLDKRDILKGGLTHFDKISIPLNNINEAVRLILKVSIPDEEIENTWDIWVYPIINNNHVYDVKVIEGSQIGKLEELMASGKRVLLILDKPDLKDSRESCFAPIFWNSLFKWPQKSHTLGIFCNPQHPALKKFPTDSHSNWQWWDIAMNANALNLNALPRQYEPIVSVIDSYHLNNKLAYLFEARVGSGKLIISTIDLINNLDSRPASRQLKNSILQYMDSDQFMPGVSLQISDVYDLLSDELSENMQNQFMNE